MKYVQIIGLIAILLLAGCSQQVAEVTLNEPSGSATVTVAQETEEVEGVSVSHEVVIDGMNFDPYEIEVNTGDTIVFRAADNKNHTLVFADEFTGEVLHQQDDYEYLVTEATGVYEYYDTENGGTGLIAVQ